MYQIQIWEEGVVSLSLAYETITDIHSTPLLGETFEDVRMNFIAEKVVHKPLVIAYHASGSGWELNATSSGKTKFWGTWLLSLCIFSELKPCTAQVKALR